MKVYYSHIRRREALVTPDDQRFPVMSITNTEALRGHSSGEKVVVRIDSWGDGEPELAGTVVETLGRSGDLAVEVRSVLRDFNLTGDFPPNVTRETQDIQAEIPQSALAGRLDLRSDLCFTIDPEDAKDFDDAVSLLVLPDGTRRLGVHIADVSYYVREGTALDGEALRRGTSVYLPHMVIPMLREKLSNQLCSLRPGEDRLTFSVIMDLSATGDVRTYSITPSVLLHQVALTRQDYQIEIYGHLLTRMAFLLNLPAHEFTSEELDYKDPGQPLLICARVVKPVNWQAAIPDYKEPCWLPAHPPAQSSPKTGHYGDAYT